MSRADDPRVTTTSGEPASIAEGPAPEPVDQDTGQHGAYWVLTEAERAKGFVRPVRTGYVHAGNPDCGVRTVMSRAIAETYAADPKFYGATFCAGCKEHLPVSEFLWDGTDEAVGS